MSEITITKRQRSYTLFLLVVVFTSSHIDRQIVAILQEPIKQPFQISDTQLGLLTGVMFAVFYATLGMPMAMWADRGNRRNLIALSITLWSVMTALCGMAQTFMQLLLTRILVLVLGGYVFMPLTKNFADRSGWRSRLTYLIGEFYNTLYAEYEGMEQLVVLSRVLRHDSTRYRSYNNVIVNTVNGKAPRDFADFVSMLKNSDRAILQFEGVNIAPLVLDRKRIEEIQEQILKTFGITESGHVREGN